MEEEQSLTIKVISSMVFAAASVLLGQLYHALVLKPKRIRSKLRRQGIKGPSPVFFYGNIPEMKSIHLQTRSMAATNSDELSHAWPAAVFPHLQQWRNEYGPIFLYSTGSIQTLCIMDPEMAKEVSLGNSSNLGKPSYISRDYSPLFGQGIFSSNGPYWTFQRKIIASEFYLDKVKDMVSLMVDTTSTILQSWETKTKDQRGDVEIRVDEDLTTLSADIISRACFGSSYSQGEKIFLKLHTLQKIMSKVLIGVPGLRYVPSKHNRDMWRLKEEIDSMILEVVKTRTETAHDKDLLQLILDAAKSEGEKSHFTSDFAANKFIIDNCKSIYFAGHETTATSASWCLMLLAAHPDWQARVRGEVLEVCGHNPPDADKFRSMKMLNMVIQEALRLYPPSAFLVREALQDKNLKGIRIPKGCNIQIPIAFLHQQPELWGRDARRFKPERFADGTTRACKVPQAYMPFGAGSRICAGQHFAMAELKVILSLVLSRFSFSLSPTYCHSPAFQLVIKPQHGVKLHVRRL
ncbi:cytochrome P450 714C2-like [Coffea eugenioides]|uniref:cytochrome P450 714C2-like n=1 Tax=Coffea eugenioides TaxID=49369 RepID=UPI000F612AC0|nr:cytochrome P450 714C2-like [Coffea eugenioides]